MLEINCDNSHDGKNRIRRECYKLKIDEFIINYSLHSSQFSLGDIVKNVYNGIFWKIFLELIIRSYAT